MAGLRGLAGAALLLAVSGCTAVSPLPSAGGEPTPPIYTGTLAEYLPQLAACLREAGWDAVVDPAGGGMSVDSLTAEQRPAFMQAKADCEQVIGVPPPPEPLSESEIRDRYQYLLQARQCLMELGYTISEPPSVDAFIESWSTGPWSPYSDVVDQTTTQREWLEADQKCPQLPDARNPR